MGALQKLETRSYTSYKGRMYASQRLALRDKAWNTSLLSLTVATTIASVGLLANVRMYGDAGPALFVCLAVLSLVISLVVAGLNYGARSRDLFNNYRRLQRLSSEVELLRLSDENPSDVQARALLNRYNDLLDESENHNQSDYQRAIKSHPVSWAIVTDFALSAVPFISLIIPVLVLVPFVLWVVHAS
ncbi:SLATT domain-containing protein [Arthrobacter sp. efr-133-TYG-120]|uniref:SLATT domain-containing protein n=1 Tax=Arthrobacter sp. efr-133-TYG-120 TaxID=3040280 RepID=UPI00254D06FB|nr:SLATT domain-containing protein [Arthrobacter sp. efr-133-TYG-120]